MFTRREFMKRTSIAASVASVAGLSTFNAFGKNKKNLSSLDNEILECVKRLKKERDINLTLLYPEGCLDNIKPLTTRFTQATGVNITLQEAGLSDLDTKIILKAVKEEYHYDIALPATFSMNTLVLANALLPLDHLAEKYEPENFKQYQLYDYGDYVDGKFYGYQTDGDTYLMFYNRDMLDDANNRQLFQKQYGYALTVPKTWEQLDDMIRFFHKPDAKQYGGCLFRTPGYGAWEWWSRFHAKGYYPLQDDLTPNINNGAGIEALQEMIDISSSLHPNSHSDGLFENWATYAQGETFCNIGWGGSQKFFNKNTSKIKNKLYYSPTPGGLVNKEVISCPIFNWGWNYVVSSLSPEPEIAYLFTLFASSPVMSTLSVQQDGYFDPFREEHYQDTKIQETYSVEFLKAHRQSLRDSIPDFYIRNQSTYLLTLQENIYLALTQELSAKQALDTTATEWLILHEKANKPEQQQAWLKLKEKYPEKLKSVLRST